MSHPLRRRIARSLTTGVEAGATELSRELGQPLGRVRYHLRVLTRRRVLKVVSRRRPNPPLYRWSEDAGWARDMLAGEDD